MYDVIVIGGRVAGSSTAMLLAQKGYHVLVLEKAAFPSDTLSTHQVQLPGVARLKRWGLLDQVIASNAPPARNVHFDQGYAILDGRFPEFERVDAVYSPRRIYLDKIIADAAVNRGAELRQDFIVDELVMEGERVTGIRGHSKNGAEVVEQSRVVIGADGRHSLVAKTVQAPAYHEIQPLSFAYYTYFSDVSLAGGEMYARPQRTIGTWPTNDGLVMIYICGPAVEFQSFRANLEENYMASLDLVPGLAERVRAGKRAERFYGTADLPNYYRKPFGPGWALVGDAGYLKDPISGAGIGDAFRDAELLAEALDAGFTGRKPLDEALAGYEARRNALSKPLYDFTIQLASFTPPAPEQIQVMQAIAHNPAQIQRFFGVITGAVPMQEFFAPDNLLRILGFRGMVKMMAQRIKAPRQPAARQEAVIS
jgi:flavin-dependent dehydrogenase